MIRMTSDNVALVDTRLKYIRIDPKNPPQGKVILIDEWLRQPVIGTYVATHGFTHYYPLPTFTDAEEQEAP